LELSENVTVLEHEGRTIYLIGTAHVSKESVDDVVQTIDQIQPDTVCVELCEPRYQSLVDEDRWKKLDIFKVIREGKTLFLLANLAIGAYQRRIGAQLGIKPGAELLAAVREAQEVGAEVALIDREIHITLKRAWANVPFFKKFGLLGGIMESLVVTDEVDTEQIEALKQKANMSEMLSEFSEVLPEVKQPLIDERDLFLISKIRETEGKTIVAVVGAGHVPGMVANLETTIDRDALNALPKPSWWISPLKWLIPAVVLAAFYWGYTQNSGQTFQQMLLAWALPNSVAAAVLTGLAGGKLVSVLTAFISSPITSLNPLVNTGMVVGILEAWMRKPTVQDAERINEDVQSWRGFYRNPFTRVLLVAVAATMGSALGAWIGGAWVISLLA